jgi:hypothetical protein
MASPLFPGSSPLRTATLFQVPLFFTGSRKELTCLPNCLPYNSSTRTTVETLVSNITSIVTGVSVAAGMCLSSRCLETNVVSEPFASNGYFYSSTVLALSKYATLLNVFKLCEHEWKHITTVFLRHTAKSPSVTGGRILVVIPCSENSKARRN